MRHFAVLLAAILLSACGTTTYTMPYAPTGPVASGQAPGPVARVLEVHNVRRTGQEDPAWIGTIRGGYGNPLKAVQADRPITEVVRAAMSDALAARGWMAAQDPKVDVIVVIVEFDANRYARSEATVNLEMKLRDRASGREIWQHTERVYNVSGSVLALDTGVFASTADLHALALRTMNEAIDKILNRPDFAAALLAAR